jgi:hypothetical protein
MTVVATWTRRIIRSRIPDFSSAQNPSISTEFGIRQGHVAISRNEFTLAIVEMRQRAETINLQFVDELIGVERLRAA